MKKTIFVALVFLSFSYAYPAEDIYEITGKDYFPEVKRLLSEAKKSIYLSMYLVAYYPDNSELLSNQLTEELVKAQQRGVDVKVILDQGRISRKRQYNDQAYFYLKNNGIDVAYDLPTIKLHDKLLIIDEKIVVTGSHNWTQSALRKNREISVVIKNPELAHKLIEWIKKTPHSPRRTPSEQGNIEKVFIPYQFLTNPEIGGYLVKVAGVKTFKLYVLLLGKWNNKILQLDYQETADVISIADNIYRRGDIHRILRHLSGKYHLIKADIKYGKPAQIILLDYKDKQKPLIVNPEDSFAVPLGFWNFKWIKRLSPSAQYVYFINIVESDINIDPYGWWSYSQQNLENKYHLGIQALSVGIMELNRYNLLDVEYGPLTYPLGKGLTAPQYRLLPLYSWEWHEEQIAKLKELYGTEKVEKARHWAGVTLDENNLDVIEKLINYADQYGDTVVQYAVDKLAQKRIGNQKRNFRYLEGIIRRLAREKEYVPGN